MSRFLRSKSRNYVTISNEIMREKGITLKAKGLYALVMSLPDDWDFTLKGICAISKENYTAINAAVKELIEAGYCKREQAKEDGRFSGYDYRFFDSKNDSSQSAAPISEPKPKEERKEANEDGLAFEDFYKLYPLKKSRQTAEKAWKRLNKKDRQQAIEKLPDYINDCVNESRSFKHPATYLNQRTWEDDFGTHSKATYYEVLPTDSEQEVKYKRWMRKNYPNIETTAKPLSFSDFMALHKEYGTEEMEAQLAVINENIGKYKHSDINAVIRYNLSEF